MVEAPECQICMEIYDETRKPTTLACGHTICMVCVKNLSIKQKNKIICPFDKTTLILTEIKPNYDMLRLIKENSEKMQALQKEKEEMMKAQEKLKQEIISAEEKREKIKQKLEEKMNKKLESQVTEAVLKTSIVSTVFTYILYKSNFDFFK